MGFAGWRRRQGALVRRGERTTGVADGTGEGEGCMVGPWCRAGARRSCPGMAGGLPYDDMAVRRIPLPGHLAGEAWIQVVRIRYQPGDAYDEHDHEFAEVFWIESGCALHQVNGARHELR